jgi:hypothetical protein
MRTEKRLLFEFVAAASNLLIERFNDQELAEMRTAGDSVFLMVETSGRLFKGVHCVRKKSTGEQEQIFFLREGDEE